ncbi:MAG TPA: carboxypeptidase regulatory-like domain-containing protein [Bryobacteraceae bacterium]|nr:carboxypeptidase regulatory-like domain-containing protein [Bryobacteraceae bacterium]
MLFSNRSGACRNYIPASCESVTRVCSKLLNTHNLSWFRSSGTTVAAATLLSLAVLVPSARSQSGNFTIVALPDTQYYSESYPDTFTAQTQWIVSNAAALNVQMVLGLGDVVNTATNVTEFQNADRSIKLLDSANIPYLLAVGNHDYSDSGSASGRTSELTNFNTYFGPSRYQNYSWYKGQYPAGSNENFYGVLTINGKTYLFLMLELFPRDSALAWANSVLAAYPTAEVIVVTHAYVYTDNTLVSRCDNLNAQAYNVGADNNGDNLWTKFVSQHPNISLVLSGHFTAGGGYGASRRADLGINGNLVNQILSDYQEMQPGGGNGYLRILQFNPSANGGAGTITVSTYSPTLNNNLTDLNNQFTVPWHSTGANPTGTGTVSGIVKDVSSCNAVSGATASTTGASQSSNASGNFTLSVPTPQQYTVDVQASGYFPTSQTVNAWTGYPELSKYFISTTQPGSISGTVKDSSGTPIPGVTISYSDGSTTTDSNGNYSFSNVLPGTYTVTASANGFQTSSAQNVSVAAGGAATVNFTFTAAGSIAGTVVNSSGTAIPGATVSYSGSSTTTLADGTYTLSNVPVGTYGVTASASGFQSATQMGVTVKNGATTTVNFTLPNAGAQSYSISGNISPASNGNGTSLALSAPSPILVQSAHGSAATGSTSATVSFGAASGAGNTIVIFSKLGGTTISSVTDNQSGGANNYTSVLGPVNWGVAPNPTDRWAQVFIAKNVIGGSVLTVTVKLATGSTHPIYLAALEYSGVDPANPVNATAVGTGKLSQNGAPTTSTLNTTVGNAKLVATSWDSNESYNAAGNGTGYTTDTAAGAPSQTGGPGWANLTEDSAATGAGPWKATASSSGANGWSVDDWAILLIALAPAPGTSQTVTADGSGNYTFTAVSNGTYTITPSKSGVTFTPATQAATVASGNVTGVNFTSVAATGTVSGTVTNSSGTAVSGATVSYTGGSTTTASDGTYTLTNVSVGTVSLTAAATGYQSSTQSVAVTTGATTTQNFSLTAAAGTVSGTVSNSGGTAISGATVSYSGGSTTTASNGTYTLSNVPAGIVNFTASATGYQSSIQSVTVAANTTTTQNFTLATAVGTLSGTVKNSAGTAISGASVSYTGGSTVTAANGTYTLSNVPVGTVNLTASAAGYQSSTQAVTVAANTTTTQNFTLSTAVGTISGTVTNSGGTAISGATVSYSGGSTTTASNGTYTLSNVPTGTVSLTAAATGYQSSTQTITVTASTTTTQNFTLSAAVGTISGSVTSSAGTAISGATVSYSGGSVTTGANGTYTLSNVPAGAASVTAAATGYQSSTQNVTVTAGNTTTQNFTLSTSAGAISGTVKNATGAAISGATVSYGGGSATTAANGSYTLSNVPVGTVSVTATAAGYQSSTQSATVAAGATTTLNFTLAATVTVGTISGTVTNSSGTAISGATVSYSGGTATTLSNGSYTLSNVPAGTVSVTASATGYQSSTQSVTVSAGATTTLNFTLSATVSAGTVSGTVTNSSGTAISGVTVSYSGGSASTAGNGSYTLSNVPVGTVSITATATGYQSSTQSAAVTAGATTTLNFTLSASVGPTYSIQGAIAPASNGAGSTVALGGAVPVLVQSAHGSKATGSSSATVSFGSTSGAHNAILIFTKSGNVKVSTISDNQAGGSNTYTSILGPTQWGVAPNPTDRWGQVFLAKNIAGGTKLTITVNFTGSSSHPLYLVALEYSGVDSVNPINATGVGSGKVSLNGAPTTANVTTKVANAKLVATAWDSNESYNASGNGTGYTANSAAGDPSLTGGPGWANLTEDESAVTSGTWKATASSSGANGWKVDDWLIQLIVLTPATSQTATADASGNYTFTGLNSGTYTVTPSKSGRTFTPASQSVSVSSGNVTGVNFTAN